MMNKKSSASVRSSGINFLNSGHNLEMLPSFRIDNGMVWVDNSLRPLSIVIQDDKIIALPDSDSAHKFQAQQVVDASGCWILPGGVDLHTHISDGAETFFPGSCCAAAGGITTIFDMAPFHACVTQKQLSEKSDLAHSSCVIDFGLVAGIVVDTSDLTELDEMSKAGAAYFKVFQPSEPPVSTNTLWNAVQTAARTGLRLGLHAEETAFLLPPGDPNDPLSFPHSRPAIAETSSAALLIEMARAAGAPIHICHVSSGSTVDLIAWGKAQGVDLTCEVPAHYLVLDESAFSIYGARVKTTPPLRSSTDCEKLWQALEDGVIDAIACDHYTESLIPLPIELELINSSAAGIAGLEVSLPLIMDAVLNDRLSLSRFVKATSEKPAKIAGISHKKGQIATGMDADLSFWDPQISWKVAPSGEFSRIATTPFNGWQLKGQLKQTWVRGHVVWNEDNICVPAGYGRWIKSKKG